MSARPPGAVAVTGLGVVCSIAAGVAAFEAALRAGRSGVRAGEDGAPAAAALDGFELAAAVAAIHGLSEETARRALRVAGRAPLPVQAALAAALEAWTGAGLDRSPIAAERLALVVAGSNLTGRLAWDSRSGFERNPAWLSPRFALQSLDTDHVGVLSQALGVRGEGFTVGGASASGNLALVHGARLIAAGAAEACLVVGALADLSPIERQGHVNLGAMAPAGDGAVYRPFDRRRSGFVAGQAAACLVLESAASAARRGAAVAAELAGGSIALDGNALADPSEEGELRAMSEALAHAGVGAGDVAYINAHGSGSPLGDDVEARALRRLLGDGPGHPWINSTKALTGHCLSAAGVVEAVATVVQMRGGFVHPNPGLDHPVDDLLRFAGRRAEAAAVPCALSNGFGFGGFNSSVVFVRHRPPEAPGKPFNEAVQY